jgi:hypothetical protein
MARRPMQYKIYKGVTGKFGALRLNLKPAPEDDSNHEEKPGCVFIEMAPATGPNQYDWENGKIVMALSITDIPKIIAYLTAPKHEMFEKDGKLKLFHDKGAGTSNKGQETKVLEINKEDGRTNFFVSMYANEKGVEKKATCTVAPDEALAIRTLLTAAIPRILAW